MWRKAPAKINLFLKVLNKREDGYHDIYSVMQKVALYDSVSVQPAGREIEIYCDSPSVAKGRKNIAFRAARVFLKRCGYKRGLRIFIKKRIPVGGGLGGGSSDAAAVLLELERILCTGMENQELRELASIIGSDVPFFISPSAAGIVQGRGERVTPCRIPLRYYLLIYPGFEISSAWAYEQLKFSLTKQNKIAKITTLRNIFDMLDNDLEYVCMKRYPVLRKIKTELLGSGASSALMSGSGSTVFGVFESESAVRDSARRFSRRYWTKVVEGL